MCGAFKIQSISGTAENFNKNLMGDVLTSPRMKLGSLISPSLASGNYMYLEGRIGMQEKGGEFRRLTSEQRHKFG